MLTVSGDYCASKFGLYGMNEALRMELKHDGFSEIRTTIVCPFLVDTGLFAGRVRWTYSSLIPPLSPSHVAEQIVRGIEEGREEIWLPGIIGVLPLFRLLPVWILDAAHAVSPPRPPAN